MRVIFGYSEAPMKPIKKSSYGNNTHVGVRAITNSRAGTVTEVDGALELQ